MSLVLQLNVIISRIDMIRHFNPQQLDFLFRNMFIAYICWDWHVLFTSHNYSAIQCLIHATF